MARPKLITAPVDDTLYERVKFYCEKTGTKMSDFARDCIIARLPKNLMAVMEGKEQSFLAAQQAHDAADHIDGFVPLNAAPRTEGVPERTHGPRLTGIPGHPCVFLRAEFNGPFNTHNSQGTCYAPNEHNRACFWVGGSARQCPSFRAKPVR